MGIKWNHLEHTDDENTKWCLLRAIEWGRWPLFVTQPIIPFLFLVIDWPIVILIPTTLTWLWALIRYNYVSVSLASFGAVFVQLKWLTSLGVGIYFLTTSAYTLATISGLWPIAVLIFMFIIPSTEQGKLQRLFMKNLGYDLE